jgi:hypothetical protein
LAWEEVLHVVRCICAVGIDNAPTVEHSVVWWSAGIPAERDLSRSNPDRPSIDYLQEKATEQARIRSPFSRPVRLGVGVDMALRDHGQRSHGLERRSLRVVIEGDFFFFTLEVVFAGNAGKLQRGLLGCEARFIRGQFGLNRLLGRYHGVGRWRTADRSRGQWV